MTARSLARRGTLPMALSAALLSAAAVAQTDSANEKPGTGRVVEIFLDRGDVFVRSGTSHGVKVGIVLPVLGPTIGNTKERRTVGSATVLEVWDTLCRVSLDKAASSHNGPKMARVDKAPAPEVEPEADPALAAAPVAAPPPPPPPVEVAAGKLKGRAEKVGLRITVWNDSQDTWTHCELRLPSNWRYLLSRLEAGRREGIMGFRFTQDGVSRDLPDSWLAVKCDQGTATFPL